MQSNFCDFRRWKPSSSLIGRVMGNRPVELIGHVYTGAESALTIEKRRRYPYFLFSYRVFAAADGAAGVWSLGRLATFTTLNLKCAVASIVGNHQMLTYQPGVYAVSST